MRSEDAGVRSLSSAIPMPLRPVARRIYRSAINSRAGQRILAREVDSAFAAHLADDFVEGKYGEAYGVTRGGRAELIQAFRRNTKQIITGTSLAIHILLAREILSIPPSVEGNVVECGAWKGACTASLSLVCKKTMRRLIVCDSFQGLPHEGTLLHTAPHFGIYGYYREGMFAGRLDEVRENVRRFGALEVCEFVPGFFSETLQRLSQPIVFAFLDVDLASSTLDCVRHIWPLLVENGCAYTDDAGDMDIVKLFFDDAWWRENLHCGAPGYIGSGCGLPLNSRHSSLGYARKVTTFRQSAWKKAEHLYYPVHSSPAAEANPMVSIVLPTRNRTQFLERSLTSIASAMERYPNSELIVIDGGSTDGATNIIKSYESKIAYWSSEPDSGVAEAVNKGIRKSRGEIVLLFGDDDVLLPDAIESMVSYLRDHRDIDAVFGAAENIYEKPGVSLDRFNLRVPVGRLTLDRLLRVEIDSWPSPEMQFSWRRVYERWGLFDERYRYAACLEAWCRAVRGGAVFEQIDRVVAHRHYTLLSGNIKYRKALAREVIRILWDFGGPLAVLRTMWARRKVDASRLWYKFLGFTYPIRHPIRAMKSS
jgi:O-methyltransferase